MTYPLNIINEVVLNPRVNCYFEMHAAPTGISFLQHNSDGSQPIAICNSLDKSVEFFGGIDIPNLYNKTDIDAIDDELSTFILNTYTKPEVEALLSTIDLVDYYIKTQIDSTLSDYSTITYLQGNYMTTSAKHINFND